MTRVAAGVLIALGGIAISGAFPPRVSAAEAAAPQLRIERPADVREVTETRGGSRVLALLVTLEALRGNGGRVSGK